MSRTFRESHLEWSSHVVHPRNVGVKRQAIEVAVLLAPVFACENFAIGLYDGVHGDRGSDARLDIVRAESLFFNAGM
jgi:hypothetical protein